MSLFVSEQLLQMELKAILKYICAAEPKEQLKEILDFLFKATKSKRIFFNINMN
jgi:hypothetical protein